MKIIKKTIAALISTVMLASVSPVSSSAAVSTEMKFGDVNRDGIVNDADFTALKKFILGDRISGVTWESADLNKDGMVNSKDLVRMMRILSLNLTYNRNEGNKEFYEFNYKVNNKSKVFTAIYTPNNWKIKDSYLITDMDDMVLICSLLKNYHAIPNKEYSGMRSAENMANEWDAHNHVYYTFGFEDHTKDVDIDPSDDGMTRDNWLDFI